MAELYSYVGEGWKQEDDITILTLSVPHPEAELRRTP
jgi:hypothetical protein